MKFEPDDTKRRASARLFESAILIQDRSLCSPNLYFKSMIENVRNYEHRAIIYCSVQAAN